MNNNEMPTYVIEVNEDANGKKRFVYPDFKFGNVTLKGNIIKRIYNHNANMYSAVIDAIASIIAQDSKLGVNKIGLILRTTSKVAINNACLSAGVKAVKQGLPSKLVAEAMASALEEVATKKAKKTTKKATEKNAAAGVASEPANDDDLSEIKNAAVLTAVKIAEDNLKARIASKLASIVDASRKAKDINGLVGELTELITFLRIPEEIIQCKAENVKAVKKSKAAKSKAAKAKAAKAKKTE